MAKVRFTLRARLQMQSAHSNNKDLSQSGPMAAQEQFEGTMLIRLPHTNAEEY